MLSIKYKFEEVKRRNPDLSDYVCFCRAITSEKFDMGAIRKNFNSLVKKSDFLDTPKKLIFQQMSELTKTPRADHIRGKISSRIKVLNKDE